MGEYTNDIGLHVETNFCEVAKTPHTIAAPIIKAVGMSSDNCPPKKVRNGYPKRARTGSQSIRIFGVPEP